MAGLTAPPCLRSREGLLWGDFSLDREKERGVATLHGDHTQNLHAVDVLYGSNVGLWLSPLRLCLGW